MKKIFFCIFLLLVLSSVKAQLDTGLIAKYSFNWGDAHDEAGLNDGIIFGPTTCDDRFGNPNKAFSFDGVDDYIHFGLSSDFEMGTNDFSISLWVNYSDAQMSLIFGKRSTAYPINYTQYSFLIMNSPLGPQTSKRLWGFLNSSTANYRQLYSGDLSGSWHHLVMVHEFSSVSKMYIDGQLQVSVTSALTGNLDVVGHPLVAGYATAANNWFYKGMLDDIRIFNYALSQGEVIELYDEPNPALGWESPDQFSVSFFPNPARESIRFTLPVDFEIWTVDGRKLIEGERRTELNVGGIKAGLYNIKLREAGKREWVWRKVVVN